jgi:hypothetical protein
MESKDNQSFLSNYTHKIFHRSPSSSHSSIPEASQYKTNSLIDFDTDEVQSNLFSIVIYSIHLASINTDSYCVKCR